MRRIVLLMAVVASGCGDVSPVAPGRTAVATSLVPAAPNAASDRPADDRKVAICHGTEGADRFILVSVAAAALDAHLAHGDGRPGGPVPDQPNRTFGPACEELTPTRVIVGFGGLVDNGAAFSTYTESGFTVSVTGPSSFTRDWQVGTFFGNPAPFIRFSVPAGAPSTSGAVAVSAGGATFRLISVDLYSSITPIPYELRGFLDGAPVFTATGTVPNTFGNFRTVSNPYADVLVDSVIVVLTNPVPACCGNPVGLDNLVLLR